MNNINSLLFFVGFILISHVSCTGQKTWIDLDVEQAISMFDSTDVVFLDVREPDELEEDGFVEGSINIDFYQDDFEDKLNQLDRSKKYVVYCRSGRRSAKTCEMMNEMGFEKLYNIKEGYDPAIKRKLD